MCLTSPSPFSSRSDVPNLVPNLPTNRLWNLTLYNQHDNPFCVRQGPYQLGYLLDCGPVPIGVYAVGEGGGEGRGGAGESGAVSARPPDCGLRPEAQRHVCGKP